MTLALIAISAGLGSLALIFCVLVLRLRSAPCADGGVASAISDINLRMDSMVRELTGALELAEEESRRLRLQSALMGSIELEEVLERTLEAARTIAGVDAALVTLRGPAGGKPVVATLGLSSTEAELGFAVGPPDGPSARTISLSYRYDETAIEQNGSAIRGGLAVPLLFEGEPIGHLAIFTRSAEAGSDHGQLPELEVLAERAGPALENARRFGEARTLADFDGLTGLHNRRYFHETLAREVSRANRYGRELSLLVFDLDDFKAINDRIGHLAGDGVLADAAERIREVKRSADVACRVGGDEFAVILPESTVADADHLSQRIQTAISARTLGNAGRLRISAGVAELRPTDDAASLFQRADDALYQAKGNGKGQTMSAGGG
jgi:diguanylate cyclase (GGDEF)-like protein